MGYSFPLPFYVQVIHPKHLNPIPGPWTPAEEAELTRIVKRLTIDCGKPADQDVFWGRVSREMGGKRSRQQCRIKWTDSLSKTVKNADKGARWGQEDAFILVHK